MWQLMWWQPYLILFGSALILAGISFFVGALAGAKHRETWWRWEMVRRGHARYHFYDGAWCWLEDLPKHDKKIGDPAAWRVAKQQTAGSSNSFVSTSAGVTVGNSGSAGSEIQK